MTTSEAYLKNRYQDQLDWYNKKSNYNRRIYQFLRISSMICAISLPFLTSYADDSHPYVKISIGLIGATIALSEGLLNLFKCHDNWVIYRTASGNLQREKVYFETLSGQYSNLSEEKAFRLFVNNTEQILSNEANSWLSKMDDDEEKK